MRKVFIAIAAAAVVVGCSDQSATEQATIETQIEVEVQPAVPITFSTEPTISVTTKSDIVYESADIASFGVYAYTVTAGTDPIDYSLVLDDDANIMSNRRVQRADLTDPTSSWSYTPIEYWDTSTADENGNDYTADEMPAIYFLAYTPYSSGLIDSSVDGSTSSEDLGSNYDVNTENGINSYKNNNYIYISYTMPSEVRNQPDIMVSEPVVMAYAEATEDSDFDADCEPVSFEFNHTLATVGFKLNGNSSYQVLAVALVGIYDYADMIIGSAANDWYNKTSRYNSSNDIFYNSTSTYYSQYGVSGIYFAGLSQEEGALIPEDDATGEPKIITAEDGYLMVIPQSIMNDVRVHVQYTYASEEIPEDYDSVLGYVTAYTSYTSYESYDFPIFTLDYYLGGSRGWYGNNNYYYVITLP